MPSRQNPYYQNEHWARASENLAKYIQGPDPSKQLEAEVLASELEGQDLENRRSRRTEEALGRVKTGMRHGALPDGGTRQETLGGGHLTDPESGMPTMYSGLAQADPSATGQAVTTPTSQEYGQRELMGDMILADQSGDAPELARALGGAELAEGRITPDQMRAYQAGAGQEPDEDMALTQDRADQLRAEDRRHDLAQAFAEEQAAFEHSPEALVAGQVEQGNPDVASVLAEELGVRDPLSTDEDIARRHRTGDTQGAAELSGIRYGEGPAAPAGADFGPDELLDYEEHVHSIANDSMPDVPSNQRSEITRRAAEIARQGQGQVSPTEAVHMALDEGGGLHQERGLIRMQDPQLRQSPAPMGHPVSWPDGAGPAPEAQQRPDTPRPAEQPSAQRRQEQPSGKRGQAVLLGPDGAEITDAEIEETAQNRDMSSDQVLEVMFQRGAKPLGQGIGGEQIRPGDMLGTGAVR